MKKNSKNYPKISSQLSPYQTVQQYNLKKITVAPDKGSNPWIIWRYLIVLGYSVFKSFDFIAYISNQNTTFTLQFILFFIDGFFLPRYFHGQPFSSMTLSQTAISFKQTCLLFLHQNIYLVGTHWSPLYEAIPMSTNKIYVLVKIKCQKKIF